MTLVREQAAIEVVKEYAPRAVTLHAIDRLAKLARDENVWDKCEAIIHERNMRLLGKDGKQAIYIKDGITYAIWDGWTLNQGKRYFHVHARALCENGFRYVRQGKIWREIE